MPGNRSAATFGAAAMLIGVLTGPDLAAAAPPRGRSNANEKGGNRVSTKTEGPGSVVVGGNTRFALDLFGKLKGEPGNLIYSPYSVSTALAMTAAGARGETAREMAAALHLPDDPGTANAGFHALTASLLGEPGGEPTGPDGKKGDQLVVANALWLGKGTIFLPAFLETARGDYAAGLYDVDFRHDPEGARKTINAKIEEQTRDKIRDLIGPNVLGRDTSLVLTNAIYFKGAWVHPFAESATRADGAFTTADGHERTVPMMGQVNQFGYREGPTFQVVELPYAGGGRSMVVVLPKTAEGLPALEASLDAARLDDWLGKLAPTRVALELPKFRVEQAVKLGQTLQDLGMKQAFDARLADFSGMTGKRDQVISAVIHKAFVDVNEAGTEAAAATAVVMLLARAARPTAPPVVFRADHPFLFLIRDRATGSVLFLGRVADPKA